jgi:3',5'-cyclic AMP phosphodiesterase CpdA
MIHISDLHFGQKLKQRALLQAILHNEKPTPIFITGDITHNAFVWEFEEAKRELKPLIQAGFLLLIGPGNHDNGPAGITKLDNSVKLFQAFLEDLTGIIIEADQYPYCFIDGQTNTANFVLNSCAENAHLARGFLGYAQLQRLAEQVEQQQRAGRKIVVSLHHHPIKNNWTLLLKDAPEFLALLAHRCDVLLFGHKHQAAQWSDVYGIKRIFAADQSPVAKRYRKIDVTTGRFEWISID